MRGRVRRGVWVLLAFWVVLGLAVPATGKERCGTVTGDDAALATAWQGLTSECGCAPASDETSRREFRSFLACARGYTLRAIVDGTIRSKCRATLMAAARRSTCARPAAWTTCCLTNRASRTSCKIRKSNDKCASTNSRFAELGTTATCLDACDQASGPQCWNDSECDDANGCTIDWCEPAEGCVHVDIAGCVPGGEGSGGTSCTGTGTSTWGLSAQELTLLDLINGYRASVGQPPVTACTSLDRSAQDHANDMRDKGYFSHVGADGSEFWERACDAGYLAGCGPLTYMGEIIAGYDATASGAMNQWLGSPGHKAIMGGEYYHVAGIGHACGGPLANYWVVDFAGTDEPSCH